MRIQGGARRVIGEDFPGVCLQASPTLGGVRVEAFPKVLQGSGDPLGGFTYLIKLLGPFRARSVCPAAVTIQHAAHCPHFVVKRAKGGWAELGRGTRSGGGGVSVNV